MLDEKLEYKEYNLILAECGENHHFRLKYETLGNQLTGIERALYIIARNWLYTAEDSNTYEQISAKLTQWLFELQTSESLNSIILNDDGSPKSNTQEIINGLHGLKGRITQSLFPDSVNPKNDINKLTLEKIIADALNDGPLKQYGLVAKDDFFNKGLIIKHDPRTKTNKLNPNNEDYLLKATAAFLLNNKLQQQSVAIVDGNVLNWCYKAARNIEYLFEDSNEFVFEKRPVFANNANTIKYYFHERWINNFKVIEITSETTIDEWFKANPDWHYYYIDKGSAETLEQHEF